MNETISDKLYSGNAEIFIPVTKKYHFQHDGASKIEDANGFALNPIGKSPGIINVISPNGFWAITFQDDARTYIPADDVPMEINMDEEPDIMTRMRNLITAEVMNKYGQDSNQVETLEEALDFDIDGDGEIGYTAAEIAAMPDEQLIDLGLVRDPTQADNLNPAPHDPNTGKTEPQTAPTEPIVDVPPPA
jgi:hypothetical protein